MTDAYKAAPKARRTFFDPCLEMRPTRGSTLALVVNWIEGDPFDDLVLEFRGKTLRAKAAHPEIRVGQLVSLFEWPKGVYWGTCMQPSWYEQPVEELIKNGRSAQAAINYAMRDNPKYWPALIRLDKRGQPYEDGDSNFDDQDKDKDGYIDRDDWTGDPWDFDFADADGDGRVSREEWDAFQAGGGSPVTIEKGPISTNSFGYRSRRIWVTFPSRIGSVRYQTALSWFPLVLDTRTYGNALKLASAMTYYPASVKLTGVTIATDGTNVPSWSGGSPIAAYEPSAGTGWLNGWPRYEHQMPINLCLVYVATIVDDDGNPLTNDFIYHMLGPIAHIITIPITF